MQDLKSKEQLLKEIERLSSQLSILESKESESRNIEEALLLQMTWFEQLFSNTSHAIAILDPDDRIININNAFTKIFYYHLEEVFGKKLNEVLVPKELIDEGTELTKITFEGKIADRETIRRRKDGNIVNVHILGVPIIIDGVIKSIFAIYEDISERKNMEDSKIREIELKAKSAELHAKVAEAETKALKAEHDRKTHELEDARKLQLSMLPKSIPDIPGLEISVYMKTASEVGGDYYDFQISDDGTLIVAIGDATGHGIKAGIMVTIIKTLFYADAAAMDIVPFFEKCTGNLKKMQISNLYMGLTIGKIKDNKIQISSAGMPPVYLYRKRVKSLEKIVFKSMPLGAFLNYSYEKKCIDLEKGDTLLFLSDGLPELFNNKNEILDYQYLEENYIKMANNDPETIIKDLVKFGDEWSCGTTQKDDITFIVVRIKEQ